MSREPCTVLSNLSNENTNFIILMQRKILMQWVVHYVFSAETPMEAQDTLGKLVQFINSKAFAVELEDFLVDFKMCLLHYNNRKIINSGRFICE